MHTAKHKLIAALLAMTFVAGSLAFVAPTYPARALVPTAETISLPQVLFNGVLKAVEAGAYVILRKAVSQFVKNLTKDTANYLFKGGRGKGPAYETKPWDRFIDEAKDEAVGAAIEGLAQGMVNEYEAQKKKEGVYKSLSETSGKFSNLQLQTQDSKAELDTCVKEQSALFAKPIGTVPVAELDASNAKCNTLFDKYAANTEEQKKYADANAGKLKAQGVRETFSTDLTNLQTRLSTARTTADNTCKKIEDGGKGPTSQECRTARDAINPINDEITALQAKASADFAAADPKSSEAIQGIEKEQQKKDSNLVLGQTGALTEVGRTIVDLVCKPEADVALGFFLGLGDQISQRKRKPICPLDVLKNNWSTIITDAGFQPGALISERTLNAWNNLGALVNPETSDIGVAWKVSISGYSAKDLAAQLGVTDYTVTGALGGYKGVSDVANTTITSPAGAVRTMAEGVINTNLTEGTKLTPTGHIIADVLITAGSAFLDTTLELIKDGLKKPQIARRQPKTGSGIAALGRYTTSGNPLYFPNADPNAGTEAFAEATLAVFDELKYTGEQNWDVLSKITGVAANPLCYNPSDQASAAQKAADPESCSIDEDFQQAIKQGITVREAMERKPPLLNPDGIFGFDVVAGGDAQPSFLRNFPYDSLVVLRKYRVIPVSWEIAALYIKDKGKDSKYCSDAGGKNCTLGKLVEDFSKSSSPFYQLIDPNWVLKIPPTKCMIEGYGPQVIQEIDNPSAVDPADRKSIVRGNTCVDYQTCLGENAKGDCTRGYGYCLKEESIAHFTGETCQRTYNSCRAFTDSITQQSLTVLTNSLVDYQKDTCTEKNAGCAWYSSARQYQTTGSGATKQFTLGFENREQMLVDNKVQKEWSSAPDTRVFLASSVQACRPEAQGCRQVNGPAGTSPYLRLPPASLECDKDGVKDGQTIQWYKRAECQQYTLLCKSEFTGCAQYVSERDRIAVTGFATGGSSAVNENRCPFMCANIFSYAEQKTWFDEFGGTNHAQPSVYFSADTAQKCDINDVGCEEFTNLDAVARGGEGREYYTYLQRCEQHDSPETIPANEIFYSFVGSDTAGGQPEKYYIKGTGTPGETTYAPDLIDKTDARKCDAATVEKEKFDPRIGAILCREFVNSRGTVFYAWTDNLTYRTADCTSYRRALDGAGALTNKYSPQYSRQCSSAAAANCREYRAPQAGNVRVIREAYDNFEDGQVDGWEAANAAQSSSVIFEPSNQGEIIGAHSMKVTVRNISGGVTFARKNIPLRLGASYDVTITTKGDTANSASDDVDLSAYLAAGSTAISSTETIPKFFRNDRWQRYRIKFVIPEEGTVPDALVIAFTKGSATDIPLTFYLDNVIFRETDGVEYLTRDTWKKEASCFNTTNDSPPKPNFDSPQYPNCSLYTDVNGIPNAIWKFDRVCPNEMAGCVQVTVPGGQNKNDTTLALEDRTAYIIPNLSKACAAQDNKCTAYGSPKLLTRYNTTSKETSEQVKTTSNPSGDATRDEWTSKEEWNIRYLKVTPEEVRASVEKFANGDNTPYDAGICRAATFTQVGTTSDYKLDLTSVGDLGCREYIAGSGKAYFRDPGKRICQQPSSGNEKWFYQTCSNDESVICREDGDCPIVSGIQGTCSKKEIDCPASNFARSCPREANGCRMISDPNCSATGTLKDNYGRTPGNDSGISCQRDYYFTEDFDARTKECERAGGVNPGSGCILFDDEAKNKYEYQIVKHHCGTDLTRACSENSECPIVNGTQTTCSTAATDDYSKPLTNERAFCSCDRNTVSENDCEEKMNAAPGDPDVCYNRYYQGSAGVRERLRMYKRVRVEPRYDSGALYREANTNGGSTNLTTQAPTPAVSSPLDANTLIKVRPDRQCKVWLECTAYLFSGKDKICTERKPCTKGIPGVACDSGGTLEGSNSPVFLNRLLKDGSTTGTDVEEKRKSGDRKELLTLSGYARPDYYFEDATITTGGYSLNLGNWKTQSLPVLTDRSWRSISSKLTYASIVPYKSDNTSIQKVCKYTLDRVCEDDSQCPAVTGYLANDHPCIPHPGYLNACRLYPKQETKGTKQSNAIVDACQAVGTSSGGIYGYCLQPNPRFASAFSLSTPQKGYCDKSTGQPCDQANPCGTGESCVYRYYENYCLNWLPVDRTGFENIFTANDTQQLSTIPTGTPIPVPVNVCIAQGNLPTNETTTAKSPASFTVTPDKVESGSIEMKTDRTSVGGVNYEIGGEFSEGIGDPSSPITGIPENEIQSYEYDQFVFEKFNTTSLSDAELGNAYYFWKAGTEKIIEGRQCTSEEVSSFGASTSTWCSRPFTLTWHNRACSASELGGGLSGGFTQSDSCILPINERSLERYGDQLSCEPGFGYGYVFGYIRPRTSGGKFQGWHWRLCHSDRSGLLDKKLGEARVKTKASAVIKAYTPEQQGKSWTEGNYCSQYATVLNNSAGSIAVFNNIQTLNWSDFDKKTFGDYQSLTSRIVLNGMRRGCTITHYRNYDTVRYVASPDCSTPETGLDHNLLQQDDTVSAVDSAGSRSLKVYAADSTVRANITSTNLDNIKHFFAKPYRIFNWSGSQYDSLDPESLTGGSEVPLRDQWWHDAKSFGKELANRPRIIDDAGGLDRFDVAPGTTGNDIQVSFWVDVNPSQLPLRGWRVYLPHGKTFPSPPKSDGQGWSDNFASGPSGLRGGDKFGPFYKQYDPTIEPLADQNICVEVKDNWEACTRICGKLDNNGRSISSSAFSGPQDCTSNW